MLNEDDTNAVDAFERWCTSNRMHVGYPNMPAFAEWLGDPLIRNEDGKPGRDKFVDMNKPEIRRKIDIINNSPHWQTLLKIMEIKRSE